MAESSPTDYERFAEYLSYAPDTGEIRWIKRPGKRGSVGHIAGNIDGRGYWRIWFRGRCYQGHRVAFLLAHGAWPIQEIDHINGDRTDNRLCNLREADRTVNGQNIRRPMRTNTSGLLGVSFHKGNRRWVAAIKVKRKSKFLGQFDTPEEAHACYIEAKRRLHDGCTI